MIAAPFGLAITDKKTPEEVAAGLGKVLRPPVIWLAFQDCTGCTETLLRTSHPDLGDLIMNVISLEYHETLMAGSGMQAQQAFDEAVKKYSGKYICVVGGSIPIRDKGVYMKLAGRPASEVLADVGGKAAAIIAIGSCAAWGGIPSAGPDPTGTVGVADLLPSQTIVNLPAVRRIPTLCSGWFCNLPTLEHCRRWIRKGGRSSPTTATFMSIGRAVRTSMPEIS
jgi:NiFe hydrogenase small subunit HydA